MCTVIRYHGDHSYLGRTLDIPKGYGEEVLTAPRNFPIPLRHLADMSTHYAMLGMGIVMGGFPLFYEAINEKGLSVAGLRFYPQAFYAPAMGKEGEVGTFEFVPLLAGKCASVEEVKTLLKTITLTDESFHPSLPAAPMHWMVSDKDTSIVIESTRDGMRVYDNPYDTMTNAPTFQEHLSDMADNAWQEMLVGGYTSKDRLQRGAYLSRKTAGGSLLDLRHIMDNISMPPCGVTDNAGDTLITVYTALVDCDTGAYHYYTHKDPVAHLVRLDDTPRDGTSLARKPIFQA